MARYILIFLNIVVYFLIIVSKDAFCSYYGHTEIRQELALFASKDTLNSIFFDDFESGNLLGWKQSTEWEVSTVEKISGAYSLKHSSAATSGASSIFHATGADLNESDMEWSFNLKNGKWDPSSSNKFWFYLCADTILADLINGWAVGVNISGSSDLLELWRIRKGKADSLIIRSDFDWNSSTLATIGIKRTSRGEWSMNIQKSGELEPGLFSGTDKSNNEFKNIGLYFKYTSTRTGLLWIDDISVKSLPSELFVQNVKVINSHMITLTFNRTIDPSSVQLRNFSLTDENNLNIPITLAVSNSENDRSVDLHFGKVEGIELFISVSGISDLSGKIMKPEILSFLFSFSPEVGSVLINEVLFNPYSGGVDFIELANVSEVTVSVNRLKLAARNDTLALKQIYEINDTISYLKSGQFLVCTKDPQAVIPFYVTNDPESFCAMKSFPSYPDDAGTVVLLNDSLEVIDEFSYSAKMHSSFLADENGVSLERVSLERPGNEKNNWASAIASVGYATPGLPNSQTSSEIEKADEIIPDPQVFSPNGDGYNDQLTIRYSFVKPGYIANVRIFDVVGRQMKYLVKNESQVQEGNWFWNGDSDSGQRLKLGVYIILVELIDSEGHAKTFKKTCTITDRLN